jgi:RNA polymerase sigma-70 factor, ECF subfamily
VDVPRNILLQAIDGDLEAFEEIYKLISGFVYSVAFRITGNKSDAEEVTQDVFVQIFKNLRNFKFKSSFKTWAYRITFNTAINKYRQMRRENNHRQEYENIAINEATYNKGAEFVDKENAEKTVNHLLSKLNPEQKTSILLREIEGLSYKEIAGVLKLNINTVRSRLKRARESMLEISKKGVITHGL